MHSRNLFKIRITKIYNYEKDAIEYYRKKLNEIEKFLYDTKFKQHNAFLSQSKMKMRLTELKQYNQHTNQPQPVRKEQHNIVITTYSEINTIGWIDVNYLISQAGWFPAHDLRADDTGKPISITYKAYVYQNSGENRDNIKLVLSTYNQNCFTAKPVLGIWRLDYYVPGTQGPVQRSQNFLSKSEMQTFIAENDIEVLQGKEKEFTSLQQISEISKSFSNVEFNIKLPYSVPSDGEQMLMVINNHSVKADYYYFMVPKVNNKAFLISKIGDWEMLNFIPGKANIYFRNTYVGQTQVAPAILKDTMEVALGSDQNIISTRKKLKDEEKDQVFSKRILREFTFEIIVRNNTSSSIELDLEDQIPVSLNEDIKVKLLDKAGAEYSHPSGKLLWKLQLNPGESKKIKFSYSVEHDRNRVLA